MRNKQGLGSKSKVVSTVMLHETEANFATWCEDLFTRFGWVWVHSRPARTDKGWRTPLSGSPGFPDYIFLKPPRCIIAEIKSQTGKVHPEQRVWLDLFAGVEVVETYVWRPNDRDEIEQIILMGHSPNLIERVSFDSSWQNRRMVLDG